jgi:transposase
LPWRWTLALARRLCPELQHIKTDSGASRFLRGCSVAWKAARAHLISPDLEYPAKCEAIRIALGRARGEPQKVRLLFCDETTFYRRPALGRTWSRRGSGGRRQPTFAQAPGSNHKRRIIAALDAEDGRLTALTRSSLPVPVLVRFLRLLRKEYGPDVELILVWDNWPPHHHEDVKAAAAELNIRLLYTPTYAPRTNPIEKVWKLLKDNTLRLHRLSSAWGELTRLVDLYLQPLNRPNAPLLKYVGLSPLSPV